MLIQFFSHETEDKTPPTQSVADALKITGSGASTGCLMFQKQRYVPEFARFLQIPYVQKDDSYEFDSKLMIKQFSGYQINRENPGAQLYLDITMYNGAELPPSIKIPVQSLTVFYQKYEDHHGILAPFAYDRYFIERTESTKGNLYEQYEPFCKFLNNNACVHELHSGSYFNKIFGFKLPVPQNYYIMVHQQFGLSIKVTEK